ncbi:nucleoside-diphosphate-sugar epimerase [Nitrospirillum amazonense]|uniref:Nucleoside-diphosphate-sugar epimerase n=1 Tax=Nitrospirillum amazonense TaxID=28077 RepID=A0A560F9V9_9PROT|nr:NAD(P)H-binding protein [Nitrospirillum amazonense]TWB18407.1 nucleoside-diphosphate-sugar epimerase [Nitrospirillum amazonense]TWB66072.1 nucleoside-diphosphate-sugar epimerase [Nitrospirillum amazonense]
MQGKKVVFLTGASGNMGGETLRQLLERADRFRVKALVLPKERDHPVLKRFKGHPNLEIVWGDLRHYPDVLNGVTGADQVLHIGGLVSPMADRLPKLTMEVNVGGARNIVQAIKAQAAPDRVRLVYIGTVAQTGDRQTPVHWGRTGDPIKISKYDHYAVSKTQAEAIVAESGLKHWVSLRQTGIAHANLWKIQDPIMFHSPFNGVLEWVTVGDSGRLAANFCEDSVPDQVWRNFYNIGGGGDLRVVNHEFAAAMFKVLGFSDFRKVFQPNWFATQNFHGQWYTDSDRLQELVPFRRETLADFLAILKAAVPFYVRWGARLAGGAARKQIEKLARGEGGPLHWLEQGDEAHINAYFGSRAQWQQIPSDWAQFPLGQPSRTPSYLDHGYDENKPKEQWTVSDLRQAAEFRGGQCTADHAHDPHEPVGWRCAVGHEFQMSPNLMLRGGHWCPTCMIDPDGYDAVARRSPFFAQVWRQGR